MVGVTTHDKVLYRANHNHIIYLSLTVSEEVLNGTVNFKYLSIFIHVIDLSERQIQCITTSSYCTPFHH